MAVAAVVAEAQAAAGRVVAARAMEDMAGGMEMVTAGEATAALEVD